MPERNRFLLCDVFPYDFGDGLMVMVMMVKNLPLLRGTLRISVMVMVKNLLLLVDFMMVMVMMINLF